MPSQFKLGQISLLSGEITLLIGQIFLLTGGKSLHSLNWDICQALTWTGTAVSEY